MKVEAPDEGITIEWLRLYACDIYGELVKLRAFRAAFIENREAEEELIRARVDLKVAKNASEAHARFRVALERFRAAKKDWEAAIVEIKDVRTAGASTLPVEET